MKLSSESLENLLIAVAGLESQDGKPISLKPKDVLRDEILREMPEDLR